MRISAIPAHKGFELVQVPQDTLGNNRQIIRKLAYGNLYTPNIEDLEIELEQIHKAEDSLLKIYNKLKLENLSIVDSKDAAIAILKDNLRFHYKQCISLISSDVANGWNRWAEEILDLFVDGSLYQVVWGSGNCGKSIIFAMLLYIKWRVNPAGRMVIIASSVQKDSGARVFGYIKNIHLRAPVTHKSENIVIRSNQERPGIFYTITDPLTGRLIVDEQAGIVSYPIRVNAKANELGENLIGIHPKEMLLIAMDEAQEIPGKMLDSKVVINWCTNTRLEIKVWGNPIPVDYNAPESWDMLFKSGADKLSVTELKTLERDCKKTLRWQNGEDTKVLHLSMLDSPKDDSYIDENGKNKSDSERLKFLAGSDTVKRIISKGIHQNSSAWFSQVLGFPFIDLSGNMNQCILSPAIVKESRSYPLRFRTPENQLQWYMGVDSAGTGSGDKCSICIGRLGMMIDGRVGIDLMHGKFNRSIGIEDVNSEGDEFTDHVVDTMHELSRELNIPLKNIAVETHGSGEVLRYALQKKIALGYWSNDSRIGQSYMIINPTISPTDRLLFKVISKMEPADEIVTNYSTELYMAVRCMVICKQLFNIPENILAQCYNRFLERNTSGIKYKIEDKKDMKKRGVRSPNDADALTNLIECIRTRTNFKFVAPVSGYYKETYGKGFETEQELKQAEQRIGMASRILGFATNFGYNKPRNNYYGGI